MSAEAHQQDTEERPAEPCRVAIVGSGPAGVYCAERLGRAAKGAVEVDVIDRLPTPFGLVRAGVAPDHQTTKAVARVLARALSREPVAFRGNVEVGRDVTLAELRDLYDAVVLAIGAPRDRRLGIAGEDLPGVYGSLGFVGWYNSHPDRQSPTPDLSAVRRVVVIGNGNVAIDVSRVLAKSPLELASADLDPEVADTIAQAPIEEIVVVGRRGPGEVSFTQPELAELGRLERADPAIDPSDLPPEAHDVGPALETLRALSRQSDRDAPCRIRFLFYARPEAMLGEDRVEAVRFRRTRLEGAQVVDTDETFDLPADLVVSCIGYEPVALGEEMSPTAGVFANEDGRIDDGLYVVGWAKRGPSGTIATNRAESHAVADRLLAETAPAGRPGRAGLDGLLAEKGVRAVDFAGWQRIEAAEAARAEGERPRRKFTTVAEMLASLDDETAS